MSPLQMYGTKPNHELRPFFCYYGGKWRAAPRYPFPRYGKIVEPFAGAAGYATRYSNLDVTLIERDPVIAALWRFLISAKPSEIERIPLLGHDQTVDDLGGVPVEARWLVGFWLNKGASAPMLSPSTWMKSGTRPNSYWGSVVRSRIASQVDKIKHWKIVEGSYEYALLDRATWFVDPPYDGAGRHYRFWQVDYPKLAQWVRALPGFVIACENDGATWLPFKPFAVIRANPSKNGGKRSAESIYVQDDAVAEAA